MDRSLIDDAFDHHVWATLLTIDACLSLAPEQLATGVPGTYGSILDTLRHVVGADRSYLSTMTGERVPRVDEDAMTLPELRAVMEENRREWSSLLAAPLDGDTVVVRRRDDGSETHAPLGIRLAQVLHHGSDHRSQVCTALTTLGIQPPEMDVWDYGEGAGRVTETPPTTDE